jgi:hypothetical protein
LRGLGAPFVALTPLLDRDSRPGGTDGQDRRHPDLGGGAAAQSAEKRSARRGGSGAGGDRPARCGRLASALGQDPQQRQRHQEAEPVAQRRPCPVDRLPRGAAADSQRRRDLVVAEPFQLAHDDRRPLRVGQGAQALHQLG